MEDNNPSPINNELGTFMNTFDASLMNTHNSKMYLQRESNFPF